MNGVSEMGLPKRNWECIRSITIKSNQYLMSNHRRLPLGCVLIVVQLCSTKKVVLLAQVVDIVNADDE